MAAACLLKSSDRATSRKCWRAPFRAPRCWCRRAATLPGESRRAASDAQCTCWTTAFNISISCATSICWCRPTHPRARARFRSAGFASRSMRRRRRMRCWWKPTSVVPTFPPSPRLRRVSPKLARSLERRRKGRPYRCAQPTFTFSRHLAGPAPDRPAFAFAGIAKPGRFFGDLEKAGWKLTGRRSFGDHHHYSVQEIEEIARAARSSGAEVILTTEKDMVRLGVRPQIVAVPLEVAIEPAFVPWLAARLRAVREPGAA